MLYFKTYSVLFRESAAAAAHLLHATTIEFLLISLSVINLLSNRITIVLQKRLPPLVAQTILKAKAVS